MSPAFWIIVGMFLPPLVKVLGDSILDALDDFYHWYIDKHKHKRKTGGHNG